uniref:Uncharacterized protein n=1 Tax=Setaria italica TaxID=4555 RepID=K3Z223_SETIT
MHLDTVVSNGNYTNAGGPWPTLAPIKLRPWSVVVHMQTCGTVAPAIEKG